MCQTFALFKVSHVPAHKHTYTYSSKWCPHLIRSAHRCKTLLICTDLNNARFFGRTSSAHLGGGRCPVSPCVFYHWSFAANVSIRSPRSFRTDVETAGQLERVTFARVNVCVSACVPEIQAGVKSHLDTVIAGWWVRLDRLWNEYHIHTHTGIKHVVKLWIVGMRVLRYGGTVQVNWM